MKNEADGGRMAPEDNGRIERPVSRGAGRDDLIQILWRNRWLVLVTTGIVLAIGAIYVIAATPMYTSASRIHVEQSGPRILTEAEGVTMQSKNYLYTQAELIKSTPILTAALEAPGIRDLTIFETVRNPVTYLKKKGLEVSVGNKDDIISISCDSADPREGAQLVNAVVEAYKSYDATSKRSTAGEILRILQNEKREKDEELALKLKAMLDFKTENIALASENRDGNIVLDRLESLSAEMTRAELQAVEAKFIYENIKSVIADPTQLKHFVEGQRAQGFYVTTANEWSRLETELEQFQQQLIDLRQQATPNTAAMAALEQKIGQANNRLHLLYMKFAETQLAVARQQYEAAKEKTEQLAASFEAQRQEALKLNKQLAEYQLLESDWEQTKKLCDILDDRIKQINVTEDAGCLNVTVVERAEAPDEPSWPPKARYMAMALLLGLGLSGVLALLRDWADDRIRSAEEIGTLLGLPIVGLVPSMPRGLSAAARGQKVHEDSRSAWAEAYRTIRTAVFFSTSKAKAKTILVTSPTAGEGKTTLVSNLGIAMAQAGQSTLIVEADFRRAMQHKIFGTNHQDRGLSSVLAGATELEDVIHPTQVAGLDLLTCGQDVSNPSETLHDERFAKLLKDLRKKYDRILIDSPPVLPVTDAQILAGICQITLVVLRAEKSTRKASRQAHDTLVRVGGNLIGVVLNDVPRNGRYGYYSRGDYYKDFERGGLRSRAKVLARGSATRTDERGKPVHARALEEPRIAEHCSPQETGEADLNKTRMVTAPSSCGERPRGRKQHRIAEDGHRRRTTSARPSEAAMVVPAADNSGGSTNSGSQRTTRDPSCELPNDEPSIR